MELLIKKFAARKPKDKPFCVMPLGDIQYTGREDDVALDLLKSRIDYGLEHNAQFIGMGDMIDFASPSNRSAIAGARLYDNAHSVIEDAAMSLNEGLFENILKPTKGRWLGLLEGHHFYQFGDGTTSDFWLARQLGTVLLGSSAFIRIEVTGRRPKTIWAAHGTGSGQTAGSLANRIDRMAHAFDADVYLMGHWTKITSTPINRIHVDWKQDPPRLEHRTLYLVGTGGFSKAYIERSRDSGMPRGGYVEKGLLRPHVLGNPLVKFCQDDTTKVET